MVIRDPHFMLVGMSGSVWHLLNQVKVKFPYGLVIPLSGTKHKSIYLKDICIPMHIAALSTVARIWKPPK